MCVRRSERAKPLEKNPAMMTTYLLRGLRAGLCLCSGVLWAVGMDCVAAEEVNVQAGEEWEPAGQENHGIELEVQEKGRVRMREAGSCLDGNITLRQGGEFWLEGGNIGCLFMGTEINIEGGGRFVMSGGGIGMKGLGSSVVVDIKAGGLFELTDGEISGSNGGMVTIAVGGTLRMTGGSLGHVGITQIDVLEGGELEYGGGQLGAECEIELEAGGRLRVLSGSELQCGENISGAGEVVVSGGATYDLQRRGIRHALKVESGGQLKNAGSYTGAIRVEARGGKSGVVDLGGAQGSRVEQVELGEGMSLKGVEGELHLKKGDSVMAVAGRGQ